MLTPWDLYLWFTGERVLLNRLDLILKRRLLEMGLDSKYLDLYPYTFLTIDELPLFLSLIDECGINTIMVEMKESQHMWTGFAEKFEHADKHEVFLENDIGNDIKSLV
jgi:hypothetical protein